MNRKTIRGVSAALLAIGLSAALYLYQARDADVSSTRAPTDESSIRASGSDESEPSGPVESYGLSLSSGALQTQDSELTFDEAQAENFDPRAKPPIYAEAGFGGNGKLKEHPLQYDSDETLLELAQAGNGHAAWHLAMRSGARSQIQDGKFHAVEAAALLDSGEPIVYFVENFMTSSGEEENALPYLLYAKELGVNRKKFVDGFIELWGGNDPEVIARVSDDVDQIRQTVALIKKQRKGAYQ